VTRRYEIVYIFDSVLEEAQVNAALERHHALLKPGDTPDYIQNISHWGKRTLAYPINNKPTGYYVVVQLSTEANLLPEFERSLKLDESVMRFLIVLNEGELPRAVTYPGDSDRSGDDDDDDRDGDDSKARRPRRSEVA
jgi:small subunit ribosomal protein S6